MRPPLTGQSLLARLGIEARIHPERAECVRLAHSWVQEHSGFGGLVDERRAARWKFGELACAMYPTAPLAQTLLAAHFTHWIAAVDDLVEADAARIDTLERAHLEAAPAAGADGALVAAWCDITPQLVALGDEPFARRVRAALAQLFAAYRWESHLRAERRLPPLAELVTHRHASGGLPLYLLILERAVGGPLPAQPWLAELNQRVGNLTCFANDLLSFDWDRDLDNPVNLVRVIGGAATEPQHEAAWDYFFDEWQRMQTLRAEVRAGASGAVAAYLDALPFLVSGVFVWMDATQRYERDADRA